MKARCRQLARLVPGAALLGAVCLVAPALFVEQLGRIAGLLP